MVAYLDASLAHRSFLARSDVLAAMEMQASAGRWRLSICPHVTYGQLQSQDILPAILKLFRLLGIRHLPPPRFTWRAAAVPVR
jgi:hypothetical protein